MFIGRNAQGKSNLLEAISLLGTGKSFRTSRDREVIRSGFPLAGVSGEAEIGAGAVRLSCTISVGERGTRKVFSINDRNVRYARFLGSLRVVTFVPADLQLVAGAPAGRRAFLNAALAQDQPQYYHHLARYQKALAQKSALLRAAGGIDEELLTIYNHTLIESGTAIMLARAQFVAALGVAASRAHAQWSGEQLRVRYAPNVPFEVPSADAAAAAFAAALRATAAQERARQAALIGPHRDDVELLLGDRSLSAFGSQGQQRTAVLALKVGEYAVMHERSGEAPLLLLDDVLSELDPSRAQAFMTGIGEFEQAFVTSTHTPEHLPPARVYHIDAAVVSG